MERQTTVIIEVKNVCESHWVRKPVGGGADCRIDVRGKPDIRANVAG